MTKDDKEQNTTNQESRMSGDTISAGNISGSQVAMGRGASVTINSGMNVQQTENLFHQLIIDVNNLEDVNTVDKDDAIAEIQSLKIQLENKELTEDFLSRRLRNIGRMSEDILDVVTKTLLSPTAGLMEVARKIILRTRKEFNLENKSL